MDGALKVYLAADRVTGMNSVISVCEPGSRRIAGVLDANLINGLSTWGSLETLASLVEQAGPLVPFEPISGHSLRVLSADELVERVRRSRSRTGSGLFRACDAQALARELYLDGGRPEFAAARRVAKSIEALRFIGDDFGELRRMADEHPGAVAYIEPVRDWVFARNACSVVLRVLANLMAKSPHPLEAAGFSLRRTAAGPGLVLPLCLHPDAAPLFCPPRITLVEIAYGGTVATRGFRLMTAGEALDKPDPRLVDGNYFTGVDPRAYVAIPCGQNQSELARRFVLGAVSAFRSARTASGAGIGWEIARQRGGGTAMPVFECLASATVGTIAYGREALPALCRGCGGGMLAGGHGKAREFCSGRCRSRYHRKKA